MMIAAVTIPQPGWASSWGACASIRPVSSVSSWRSSRPISVIRLNSRLVTCSRGDWGNRASWRVSRAQIRGPFSAAGASCASRSGAIVTVASTAGRVGTPYTCAYTASKHAAVGLTRAVASELAGSGVRVNAVCPTFVRTELTERAIARIVEATGRSDAQGEEALVRQGRLGRLLEPEEVADAVVFLASGAADSINGQALVIDGGAIQA